MKRRDFLAASAGVAIPGIAAAAVPCPVPRVWAEGQTPVETTCQPAGTAPDWFVGMPDLTWAVVAAGSSRTDLPTWQRGKRLDEVFPPGKGSPAICTAWTGGCVDQDKGELILPANGGHTDYDGNEVYACTMRTNTPQWVRLTNPSDPTGGSESTGAYGDGRMRPVHGWHRATWGAGKVWYAGMDGMYRTGAWSTRCWSFNRAALGNGPFPVANAPWSDLGLGLAQQSGANGEAGTAAYDRIGNRVWSSVGAYANSAGQSFYSIDCANNTVSAHNFALQGGRPRWSAIAHDLRAWILGCPYENKLEVVNLNNPVATINRSVSGSVTGMQDGVGAVYHRPSRALLCWHGYGARVRKLAIPSDPFGGQYAWSEVAPAGSNTVVPSAPAQAGTFGKFNLIEDMGNGQSALVLINKVNEPVYVFKLPLGGV